MTVKNAKTNRTQLVPSRAKKSMEGKMCLCSTRRVIEMIDDKYAVTTKALQNAEGNTNAGFVRLFHHIKSILKQKELSHATISVAKTATTRPIIRFKCSTQKYIVILFLLSHNVENVRNVK